MTLPSSALEVPLRRLQPGDGFGLLLETSGTVRPAALLALGEGSATVFLLDRVARVIRTSEGIEVPVSSVTGLQHWCLDTLVIPNGIRHPLDEFQQQLNSDKGATTMAKAKAVKKAAKAKAPKVFHVVKYEAAGKSDSKLAVKYMEAENKTHNAMIYRALRAAKNPLTFQEVMDVIGSKGFGSGSKNVENIYRWHIADLRKKGLVKTVEEKVEAVSAEVARAGEAA